MGICVEAFCAPDESFVVLELSQKSNVPLISVKFALICFKVQVLGIAVIGTSNKHVALKYNQLEDGAYDGARVHPITVFIPMVVADASLVFLFRQ